MTINPPGRALHVSLAVIALAVAVLGKLGVIGV